MKTSAGNSRFMWQMIPLLASFALTTYATAEGAEGLDPSREIIFGQSLRQFTPVQESACSLKRFSITHYDYGFKFARPDHDQRSRGDMVGTVVETTDPSCIHEYAVVQFIRGCVYDIEQNDRTGKLERYYGTVIADPAGNNVPFKFDRWQVDSVDYDPMYYSASAEFRTDPRRFDHQLYGKRPLLLENTPEAFDADRLTFFHSKFRGVVRDLPAHPERMHSLDLPSTSSWYGYHSGRNAVQVTSLEFRTCLYRTRDVPLRGSPKGFHVSAKAGGPLHCFSWASRNEFNFTTRDFEPRNSIDSFCSTPVPEYWSQSGKRRLRRR